MVITKTNFKRFHFDIQRFAKEEDKSSLGTLNLLNNIITKLGLKALAKELKGVKNKSEWFKQNINPIIEFIGTFFESEASGISKTKSKLEDVSNIFVNFIEMIDYANGIIQESAKENPSNSEINSEALQIVSNIAELEKSIISLSTNKNPLFLSIGAAGIGLVASIVASKDKVNEEIKEEINEKYAEFLKSAGTEIIKKFFSEGLVDDLIKFPKNQILQTPALKSEIRKEIADNFTKGGGLLDLIFAAVTGVLNSIDKYDEQLNQYIAESIPEKIAKHDAFIDALATFIHDTASSFTKGLDDVIFKGVQSFVSWITKREINNEEQNYVEIICDIFKTLNYKNTGSSKDDLLINDTPSAYFYGASGNDELVNYASNVTIWGGYGDDVIYIKQHKEKNITAQNNSVFGGPGNDVISIEDKNNTVYGGKGNEKIYIQGDNNEVFGDDGNDLLLVIENMKRNTINGGLGDDTIALLESSNSVIEYKNGDGNDIIYGYKETDSIKITGSYSTTTSGQDLIISVGNGYITIDSGNNKTININGKKINEKENQNDVIVTPPSFWNNEIDEIQRAENLQLSKNIKNTLNNIMIGVLSNNNSIIDNSADDVTINSGNGNDYINNIHNNRSLINTGGGDDFIKNEGYFSNFWHYSDGNNISINSSTGNDSIKNFGDSVSVDSGDGNDYIYNGGRNVSIFSGIGNDTILNDGSNIQIGSGPRSSSNTYTSDEAIIYSGAGNDSIRNIGGRRVSINAGIGNDSIISDGENSSIYADMGDDYIRLYRYYNYTDYYAQNALIQYTNGDGNDTIVGYGSDDTIQITDGRYTTQTSGNDIIIKVGNGSMTLKDAKNKTLNIIGTNEKDNISIPNNTLKYNNHSYYIYSNVCDTWEKAKTYCENLGGYLAVINDEAENTALFNYMKNLGYDTAYFGFSDAEVEGTWKWVNGDTSTYTNWASGEPNSERSNEDYASFYYKFKTGKWNDGNFKHGTVGDKAVFICEWDTIVGNSSANNDGYIYNSANNTVVNGNSASNTIDNYGSYTTINAGNGNDSIDNRNSSNSIVNADAGNDFISSAGNYNTLNGGAGKDTINGWTSNMVINGGEGDDSLFTGDNETNVTIFGGTGNDNIISNNSKTLINGGKDNDTIYANGTSATLSYSNGDGNDIIYGYDKTDTINITSGTYSTQLSGNDIIINVGNGSIHLKNARENKLNIKGTKNSSSKVNIPSDAFIYNGHSYYIYSGLKCTWEEVKKYCEDRGGHLAIINNSAENNALFKYYKTSELNGVYFGFNDYDNEGTWKWIDGTKATYTNWSNGEPNGGTTENAAMFYAGSKEYKWNDGDFDHETTVNFICEWDNVSDNDKSNSTTLKVTNSTKSPVTVTSTIKTINASTRTIAVKITGNSLPNSIKGGSGADTIQGGKGADTLTGGKGKDVFVYASGDGKDVITDYTVGQDKIKITGAKISKTSVSGSDVILTVGSGSIKVKNAKGKKLSIYNNSTSMTNTIIGSGSSTSTTLNVTNSIKSPVTAGSTIKTINASTRTTAVKITGNSLANSINGGSAADTLIGGKGNDTLTGGKGNDVFIYTNGDGNDVVTDYTAKQDKIKLTSGTISSSSIRGSDVVLKIGSGSITVKNGKNKSITVVDSNNKSSSKVYGTSSKNYIEKLWFENDDSVADDEIAAITQQNITSDNKFNNATGQLIHYDTDNILLNHQITSSLSYNRKK